MNKIALKTEKYHDQIQDHLLKFPSHIYHRGLDLVFRLKVQEIIFDEAKKEVEAKVEGTFIYKIKVLLKKGNRSISSQCTCPYKNLCKHEAAVLIAILQYPEEIKFKNRVTKLPETISFKGITKKKEHHLQFDDIDKLFENIELIPHTRFRKNYDEIEEHNLVDQNLVRSFILKKETYWKEDTSKITHDTTILWDDTSMTIKCTCFYIKNKLCGKAHHSLEGFLNVYKSIEGKINYNQIIKSKAEEEHISESNIKSLINITLNHQSINVTLENDHLLHNYEIDQISQRFNEAKSNYLKNSIQTLKSGLDFTQAIVWSSLTSNNYYDHVFLIEGKVNKTRDRILSNIRKSEEFKYLSYATKTWYKQVEKISASIQDKEDTLKQRNEINEGVRKLQNNIELLNKNINYFFNPDTRRWSFDESKIMKKELYLLKFSYHLLEVKISAKVDKELFKIEQEFFINGEPIDTNKASSIAFLNFFCYLNGHGYIYKNANTILIQEILEFRIITLFLPRNKAQFHQLIHELSKYIEVDTESSISNTKSVISHLDKKIELIEAGDYIVFLPYLSNKNIKFNLLDPQPLISENKIQAPNENELNLFLQEYKNLHKSFTEIPDDQIHSSLHVDDYILNNWHLNFFETCSRLNIDLEGLENFERIKFSQHKAKIETDLTSAIDWFELNVSLVFGEEKIARKEWIKALKEGRSYITLSDGTLGILPEEWVTKMKNLLTLAEVSKNNIQINKLRFNVLDGLLKDIANKSVLEEITAKQRLLNSYKNLDKVKEIPKSIKAKLRPYQKSSFQWLRFLDSSGFGGILADDMGLGKTLQLICLLAHAKEKEKCHALVVVPKSLIFNWSNEIEKFCPSLTTYIHHGTQRHGTEDELLSTNIILSTYGTVVRDIEILRKITFSHIILDESQAIKNPTSKRYKSIRLLQSPFKICATGTPIQNNTFDLYTQASFVNPGLLGNQSYFRQNFANPIDKEHDKDASDLLLKMIHPFILRRTKEQVAKDLPKKTESIIYCEMLPHQQKMYDELKEQIRRDLLTIDEDDSQLKFKVLDGLLRLRQLCNSPLLVDKKLKGKKAASIKIESLIFKLTEELANGNALVFSQFVQMLNLIREQLDQLGIPYAYLDGQTQNREAVVQDYMNNDECRIFLISLKAGNTGLNLTKAQYVFLVDPWWNPAAEAQAIDRTHRIGQTKKVFAYKMICKNTIEEKIIKLQKRKKKVASQLIHADEKTFKNMSKSDLLALFE